MELIDLLIYPLVGIIFIFLSFSIGSLLFNFEKNEYYFSKITFLGLVLITTFFGLVCSRAFNTIVIFFIINLFMIDYDSGWKDRVNRLRIDFIENKLLILLFFLLFFLSSAFVFYTYYNTSILEYPFYDYAFYSQVSNKLIETGIENAISIYDVKLPGSIAFYHYFELWLNGFFIQIFKLNALKSLMLIVYPLGVSILISFFINRWMSFSLLIKILFVPTIISSLFIVLIPMGGFYNANVKTIYLVIAILLSIIELKNRDFKNNIYFIILPALVYSTSIFVVMVLFSAYIIYLYRNGIKFNKVLTIIFYFYFFYQIYLILSASIENSTNNKVINSTFFIDILYNVYYSLLSQIQNGTILYYLTPIVFYLLGFRNYILLIFFYFLNFSVLIFNTTGLLAYDMPQLMLNYVSSFNFAYILLGLFSIHNIYNQVLCFIVFMVKIQMDVQMNIDYSNRVDNLKPKISFIKYINYTTDKYAIVKNCTEENDSLVPHQYMFGNYPLTIYHSNSTQVFPIYCKKIGFSVAFKRSKWGRFVENNNSLSVDSLQNKFLKENAISYILVSKNVILSSLLLSRASLLKLDSLSGYKFYKINH